MKKFLYRVWSWFTGLFRAKRLVEPVVQPRDPKGVAIGQLTRICPGKRHAWFESSVGAVRKPITS